MGIFAGGSKLVPIENCWLEGFEKHGFTYQVVFFFVAATTQTIFLDILNLVQPYLKR